MPVVYRKANDIINTISVSLGLFITLVTSPLVVFRGQRGGRSILSFRLVVPGGSLSFGMFGEEVKGRLIGFVESRRSVVVVPPSGR